MTSMEKEYLMAKLLAEERQNRIVEILNKNGSYKIADLAEVLNVSKETIRRDLIILNEQGRVKKSYGGAVAYELKTKNMATRIDDNLQIKTMICERALEYIPDQGVIYLDTGSTVTCLAHLLKEKSGLTIITNSLSAINALVGSNNTVIITGGQLNSTNLSMEGYQASTFLSTVKFELAVFGSNGFEGHKGPTTCDFLDVQAKQIALNNARTSIVLAEGIKGTTTSLTQYTSWHNIDYFITDSTIPDEIISSLEDATSVIIADK